MAGILNAIEISSRGLTVQRKKMDVVAENMANAETTETADGGPYRRKRVLVNEEQEKVRFDTYMRRAGTELARTNAGHLPGKSLSVQSTVNLANVKADEVVDPDSSFRLVYDPSHPQADEDGYVKMPDVEIINEMVDMMTATRAYEANTSAIASAKKMFRNALDI